MNFNTALAVHLQYKRPYGFNTQNKIGHYTQRNNCGAFVLFFQLLQKPQKSRGSTNSKCFGLMMDFSSIQVTSLINMQRVAAELRAEPKVDFYLMANTGRLFL